MLVETKVRESYILFVLLIICIIYYIIIAFSLLIYFNEVDLQNISPNESLAPFIAGYFSKIGANDVQRLNLPYYFCNFFFLMYYLRCYYVMFWI